MPYIVVTGITSKQIGSEELIEEVTLVINVDEITTIEQASSFIKQRYKNGNSFISTIETSYLVVETIDEILNLLDFSEYNRFVYSKKQKEKYL